jgi:hypothetical protein
MPGLRDGRSGVVQANEGLSHADFQAGLDPIYEDHAGLGKDDDR